MGYIKVFKSGYSEFFITVKAEDFYGFKTDLFKDYVNKAVLKSRNITYKIFLNLIFRFLYVKVFKS